MQLETLITELGITEHMKPLSDWRDSFLREKAEEIQSVRNELAESQAAFTALDAFRVGMIAKVSSVLQSGDPEKFAALALDFLTPEQEKQRAEKIALIAKLQAELESPT